MLKPARCLMLFRLSILAFAGFSGCGSGAGVDGGAPDTRPVTKVAGQFAAKGQNIDGTGLAVGFQPAEGGIYRSINLKPNGSFAGTAIVGMNRVFLIPVGATSVGHGDTTSGILEGYLSSTSSPLTADVKAGGENKFTFDVSAPIPATNQ